MKPAPQFRPLVNDWQQLSIESLPVDPSVKTAAVNKLKSPVGDAHRVAHMLLADPVQCLILLREANRSMAGSDNECQSLAHAISLLGVSRVEQLLWRAPDYSKQRWPQFARFRQQLQISLHAAYQVNDWSLHNAFWPQEQVFWATLLQRAPLWALWHQEGERMAEFEQQCALRGGASHPQLEQHYFGGELLPLCSRLSQQWQLPTLVQQSWQPSLRGHGRSWVLLSRLIPEQATQAGEQIPQLKKTVSHPAFCTALANQLAEAIDWDWQSRRSQRLQRITASSLSRPLADTLTMLHRNAVVASDQVLPDTHAPAAQLLGFYQRWREFDQGEQRAASTKDRNSPAPTDTGAPAPGRPGAPDPALEEASPALLSAIERLRFRADSFGNLHEVMNLVTHNLCHELGMERASISLLNRRQGQLRTYYSAGAEDSPALAGFSHELRRGDLFNKMLQKPTSVRLQAENYSQIWPLLPGNFKLACGADEFFMMSAFAHRNPIAVVYADCGNSNSHLSDSQYSLFKRLCTALSQCLGQLSQ